MDRLTLPYDFNLPAVSPQLLNVFNIAFPVTIQFRHPKIQFGLRQPSQLASGMPVPKASVNKNQLSQPGEHEVRCPGELGDVQPVSEPQSMSGTTHQHLRLRVLPTDQRHSLAASLCRHCVHLTVQLRSNQTRPAKVKGRLRGPSREKQAVRPGSTCSLAAPTAQTYCRQNTKKSQRKSHLRRRYPLQTRSRQSFLDGRRTTTHSTSITLRNISPVVAQSTQSTLKGGSDSERSSTHSARVKSGSASRPCIARSRSE